MQFLYQREKLVLSLAISRSTAGVPPVIEQVGKLVKVLSSFILSFWAVSAVAVPKVWIFETALTGAMNQRIGVASKLSENVEIKRFPAKDELLSPDRCLRELMGSSFNDRAAWPDYVINTEEWKHETDFLLALRALSPKTTRVIHLENPRHRNDEFDLIVNSGHLSRIKGENVIRLTGVATWLTKEKVEQEKQRWQSRLGWMQNPMLLVGVGGASEFNPYHDEYGKDFGERIRKFALAKNASVLIATSRRTPATALAALLRELTGVTYLLFDWNRDDAADNPYAAGMGMAGEVVVSGDSLSMMSDAVALGKKLYIHSPPGSLRPEHPRMIEDLFVKEVARPFTGDVLEDWSYQPISVADQIKTEIKKRFCESKLETLNEP